MQRFDQYPYLHHTTLLVELHPSCKGDLKEIKHVNNCLTAIDDHYLKCIDSIDRHKNHIDAFFEGLLPFIKYGQYVDPAYMLGLFDSLAFLKQNLEEKDYQTDFIPYAEKMAMIMQMYLPQLKVYQAEEKPVKNVSKLEKDYLGYIINYLKDAGQVNVETNYHGILRDLFDQYAKSFTEEKDFLKPLFVSQADYCQQLIDSKNRCRTASNSNGGNEKEPLLINESVSALISSAGFCFGKKANVSSSNENDTGKEKDSLCLIM